MPISPPVFPPKNFVPFTFIHDIQYGEANGIPLLLDMLCPFEHTKRMYEALKVAGVEANILSTTEGHSWGAEWHELAQQCLAFFQKHLSY